MMNSSLHEYIVTKQENSECRGITRFDNIEKPTNDDRQYRGLRLTNGLTILLISDSETDISAGAMCVRIGSMSDPEYLPGLAHFCEHMLFLGTKKYPEENNYTDYLSRCGGTCNACTTNNMTKYYFTVMSSKLEGALDRFAHFFIDPLFTISAMDREINAVNAEHEKNLCCDDWRIKQVLMHLSKIDHPYRKFITGNEMTLRTIPKLVNIDIRDELLKFYKQWYSANLMTFALIGKESLDDLENMVINKFSSIDNNELAAPTWPSQPYDDDQYGQEIIIIPVKDLRTVSLCFTTPDLSKYYKSMPDNYLIYLLSQASKGSILSELRRHEWCYDLTVSHKNYLHGFGFFEIYLKLTEQGLIHLNDVIKLVFQYLEMLRQKKPQKWIFDDCVKINNLKFQYKEKVEPENLVMNLIDLMQIYPMEEVLVVPYLCKDYNPESIMALLNEMVPSNCRIVIVAQKYNSMAVNIEPYYKTKYDTLKIPKSVMKCWEQCGVSDYFALPLPNAYMPENFDLVSLNDNSSSYPTILIDTPTFRVWHKQDDYYMLPKSAIWIEFSNPIANIDPLYFNLNYMMVVMIKDQLCEYSYEVQLANFTMHVEEKYQGISIFINGFSDKQSVILNKLLKIFFEFRIEKKRFDNLKEEQERNLKMFDTYEPHAHSFYYLLLLLTENVWSRSELADAIKLVTFDRMLTYFEEFLTRLHIQCFVYGNVNKQYTHAIADIISKYSNITNSESLPILARQLFPKRVFKLSSDQSYLFVTNNVYHKSSCVQLYFQCDLQNDRNNVMVKLIAKILAEPYYHYLRTKEQLGYIVFCNHHTASGVNGLIFVIESLRHPAYVEKRIENFLHKYVVILEQMPEEEFEQHKKALIVKDLKKPKTFYSQFLFYINEISLSQYHFKRYEAEMSTLRQITKHEFIHSYKMYLIKSMHKRRLLSIHIISTQSDDISANVNENDNSIIEYINNKHKLIDNLDNFKFSRELYGLTIPFMTFTSKGGRSKL